MTSRPSGPDRVGRRRFLAGLAAASLGAGSALASEEAMMIGDVAINHAALGSGPPVVLIHGASGNLNDMTFRLAPMLAAHHRVIAFDRPGHGFSGWPARGGESLSLQARLMRESLARMGIRRAVVIGHSYGGSVALAWALEAPETVSGLMLLAAPSQVWPGGLGAMTDLLASPVTGPLLANVAPLFVTKGFAGKAAAAVFAPQPVPEGYVDHLGLELVLRPRTLRANALQLDALKEQVRAMVPDYSGLRMPVEILHGTADRTVPIDIHSIPLSRQIRRARLTPLEGVGHMIHQVDPKAVVKALARLRDSPLPKG